MKKHPESQAKFFLAKLSLPVHRLMSRAAVECIGQVASVLSFDEKTTLGIKLAVEEAFCNAVEHFSGSVDNEQVHLEVFIIEDALIISIREKGSPFDKAQAKHYKPESLEEMTNPGLGSLLMQQTMDSVDFFVHGREGKEVRLTKKIVFSALPAELLEMKSVVRRKTRPTVRNPLIRQASIDDINEICRLAWRCYGFTQEEFIYDAEALTKKIQSGEFYSIIAVDPESEALIGHIGLKYHDPAVHVPEMGLAFVDPAYRCPGLSTALGAFLFDMARERVERGVFDCSVTTHTFSQKSCQEVGSRPCSILMGIAASGMQVKELATSKQEKGSVVNHYFAIDRSPATIFPPSRHQAIIEEIYQWLEVPRTFAMPSPKLPEGDSSVSIFPLPDELNVAFIIVHTIGVTTVKEVQEGLLTCRRDRMDAVYAFLPLGDPASPYLVEQLEEKGFFFAGIMPHIHDGDDRILMQYIDIPLDINAIRVYGDMTKKLFAYIQKEQLRVQSVL